MVEASNRTVALAPAASFVRSLIAVHALMMATGCATQPSVKGDDLHALASFYWPYAALAVDVYRTRGEVDSNTAMALASPWLRDKVNKSGTQVKERFELLSLDFPEANQRYRQKLHERCKEERAEYALDSKGPIQPPSCVAEVDAIREEIAAAEAEVDEPNLYVNEEPRETKDCEYSRDHKPRVPMKNVPQDWKRVPELQKQAAVRAWRLFVPDLAIDVWRRERQAVGQPLELEYAIVYRGTVGGGGWISNLRALTAILPFLVWDQYRQAYLATNAIIDQIERLHVLADSLLGRSAERTQLHFTAVGHSLGGGLAQYIYFRTPRISSVVAFNPSPIDGSSTIRLERRAAVSAAGRREVGLDMRDSTAAFHLLFEKGEFISRLAPCNSGPLWGDEGGPKVSCESVNFSRGSAFRQHNMAQLACHLFLEQRKPHPTAEDHR